MEKWKIANILQIASRRVKRRGIWDGEGSLESICANYSTLANGQVSCPTMAILKRPVSWKLLPIERRLARFQPQGEERVYVRGMLSQLASYYNDYCY